MTHPRYLPSLPDHAWRTRLWLWPVLGLVLLCFAVQVHGAPIPFLGGKPKETAAASAPQSASVPVEQTSSAPVATPYSGLLDTINEQIDGLGAQIKQQLAPLERWDALLGGAWRDLSWLMTHQGGEVLLGFLTVLSIWIGAALLINLILKYVRRRYGLSVVYPHNPTTLMLAQYAVRKIAPWIVSFLFVMVWARSAAPSLGKMAGVLLAYATVAGVVFATLCVLLFSLINSGHRRAAAHILMSRYLWLLWLTGSFAALMDASANVKVVQMLGSALSGVLISLAGLAASVCIALYVVLHRRTVEHLITDSAYSIRRKNKALAEARELVASAWHLPILLLVGFSIVKILVSVGDPGNLLNLIILSMAMLFLCGSGSLLLKRAKARLSSDKYAQARRKRSPYILRLSAVLYDVLILGSWVVCAELIAWLWGWSFASLGSLTFGSHTLGQVVRSVTNIVLFAWVIWTVLDIFIQESLSPSHAKGRKTTTARALTILPLLRNALRVLVILITSVVIFANLGLDVTPLLAGAGVIGIAVGFGAQSLVQDLITGLFILLEDSISVGDYIEVGDHAGTVENLSIRTVRLRDPQGSVHSIPFSQIKTIRNYARGFAYAVFDIHVDYATDMDKAFKAIREVGAEMSSYGSRYRRDLLGAVEIMGLQEFAESSLVIRARFKTRPLMQWDVARAFNLALLKKFNQLSIKFPFPHRDISVRMVSSETKGEAHTEEVKKEH